MIMIVRLIDMTVVTSVMFDVLAMIGSYVNFTPWLCGYKGNDMVVSMDVFANFVTMRQLCATNQ